MSDEDQTKSQDDIDSMFGGDDDTDSGDKDTASGSGEAPKEMTYDTIEESDIGKTPEKEYVHGEPMANDVTAIYDIPVQISAVLGRSSMQVSQLLKLGRGAVVELDRKVGEAIDIYVNNRLVARGEVVVVEDKLGVTMTEIVKSDRN